MGGTGLAKAPHFLKVATSLPVAMYACVIYLNAFYSQVASYTILKR